MKKLSNDEVKKLYTKLKGYYAAEEYSAIIELVNKYFIGAKSILIQVQSEYDDERYTNELQAVFVYGADDVELSITRESRVKFLQELGTIDFGSSYDDDEEVEDIVLYINQPLPAIYMED